MKEQEIKDYLFNDIKNHSDKLGFIRDDEKSTGGIIRKNKIWNYYGFTLKRDIIGGFPTMVYFTEVTSIINPILVRNKFKGGNESDQFPIFNQFLFKIDMVCNKEILENFSKIYIDNFKNQAIPFFEKWDSLIKLYEYILNNPAVNGFEPIPFTQFTYPTIMRLCNDDRYKDIVDKYYEEQKKYYDEDSHDLDNINYYNAAKELKETLEKTKPLYNL